MGRDCARRARRSSRRCGRNRRGTCPPRPPDEPTHARSESTGSDSAATVAAPAPAAGPWRRSGNGPSRRSRECLFTARAVNSASPPRNLRAGRADACLALPARGPSQTLPRTLTRTSRIATRRRRSGACGCREPQTSRRFARTARTRRDPPRSWRGGRSGPRGTAQSRQSTGSACLFTARGVKRRRHRASRAQGLISRLAPAPCQKSRLLSAKLGSSPAHLLPRPLQRHEPAEQRHHAQAHTPPSHRLRCVPSPGMVSKPRPHSSHKYWPALSGRL